jgi:hypothetical protein
MRRFLTVSENASPGKQYLLRYLRLKAPKISERTFRRKQDLILI